MASDDDERGIDWLASQLGEPASDASVAAATDKAATEKADVEAPQPTPRFGRRARRAKPTDEPGDDLPIEPPVPVAPAGPAPWWTTPLPQPVDGEAAELAEPVVPTAAELAAAEPERSEPYPTETDLVESQRIDVESAQPSAAVPEPVAVNYESATALLPVAGAGTAGVDAAAASPDAAIADAESSNAASSNAASPNAAIADASSAAAPNRHRSRRGSPGARQAALIWTAVGLLALIVLVGLFFLGQRLVDSKVPIAAPTPAPSATPTPTPTPTPEITAMQAAGVNAWDTLFGGECFEPYVSPWENDFTVVDCAASHTAQLVYRGSFGGDATTVFPGEAALAAQINLLCTAPGILDLSAAGAFPNLQMQGSYPITAEQWTEGPRNYYCFASRASAEPLTATITGPGPAA